MSFFSNLIYRRAARKLSVSLVTPVREQVPFFIPGDRGDNENTTIQERIRPACPYHHSQPRSHNLNGSARKRFDFFGSTATSNNLDN